MRTDVLQLRAVQSELFKMLHFDEIVFGPIRSRRLGASLGVNILPTKGKLCNFDCVYCECGWNKDGVSDKRFPCLAEVEEALEKKLADLAGESVPVDSITFSGNGEPTINPDFASIVDVTIRLRDKFYPSAKISVLSNATMLGNDKVLDALMKVDNPILKIDASSDELIAKINKPQGSYSLDKVVEKMRTFNGDFVLQTMFLKSDAFDAQKNGALERWIEIVRELKPREVMVYTIDRETPDKSLQKCSVEQMREYVSPLLEEGYNVQIRG